MIGLDWGNTSIKAIKVIFEGKRAILEAAMESGLDGEPWEEAMRYVLESLGIRGNLPVCATLPSRMITSGKSLMPPIGISDIKKALRWELAQYVSTNGQEITYDFAVVGNLAANGEREVVWAATRTALVKQLYSFLAKLKLRLIAVEVSPFPLLRLESPRNTKVLLADLGSSQHTLCLVEGGIPLMLASFDRRQVRSLLASSAIAFGARGVRTELYGGGALDSGNREFYSQTLGSTVSASGVPFSEGLVAGLIAPEYLVEGRAALLPQFAMALGLALKGWRR